MNELIKITINEQGQKLVSARELYLGLGLNESSWSRWQVKHIEQNEFFSENVHWISLGTMQSENKKGNFGKDFAISLEMAKHLSMMARSKKAHEYRDYFIACEEKLKEISQVKLPSYSEALRQLADTVEEKEKLEIENAGLKVKIEEDEPLVEFAGIVSGSDDSIDVGTFSKLIRNENIQLGRNDLFKWLRTMKYLRGLECEDDFFKPRWFNEPYQKYMDMNIFEAKEYVLKTRNNAELKIKTLITGHGQLYLVKKLKEYFCGDLEIAN